MNLEKIVGVIGLGYVGLPVAVAFAEKYKVIGFDINQSRLQELSNFNDRTNEVTSDDLKKANIKYTSDSKNLQPANFFIVTVPTPIDEFNKPDFTALIKASQTVGSVLKKGDIVVYESTVYPGATEEVCLPVLEKISGLKLGKDFSIGYSPERINPADKVHTFKKIKKVVSGHDAKTLEIVSQMYGSVVEAGVHEASSIKVAEAAKVIENIQRDVNIALINELAVLFDKLEIDTLDVLEASGTKWNFLPFRPGLVGGHCIGVDPYYLTHKAESVGYHPQVILSGRRINNQVPNFIVYRMIQELIKAGHELSKSNVIVFGMTFKENCPDIRNSKVADIINEIKNFNIALQVCDPHADSHEVSHEYGFVLSEMSDLKKADAIIFAVNHDEFKSEYKDLIQKYLKPNGVVIDVKGMVDRDFLKNNKIATWRL